MSILFESPVVGVAIVVFASIVLFVPTLVAHFRRLQAFRSVTALNALTFLLVVCFPVAGWIFWGLSPLHYWRVSRVLFWSTVAIWAAATIWPLAGKNVIPNQARRLPLKSKAMTILCLLYLLSRVLGALVGVGLGLVITFFASTWAGLPIGIPLGVSVGLLIGLVPPELVRHGIKLSLRWSETARLKERLHRKHGLAPHIIEELVSRGEPVEQFRDYVESLLRSNSFICRSCGKECRKKWFPDMTP